MGDEPNTCGYLCQICVWHQRAESQELMSIDALMHHGQRYHYLQQVQMDDYRKWAILIPSVNGLIMPPTGITATWEFSLISASVRHAYQVLRDPSHDALSRTFEQVGFEGAGPPTGSEEVTEGASIEHSNSEFYEVPIKLEEFGEERTLDEILGLNASHGDESEDHCRENYYDIPICHSMNLQDLQRYSRWSYGHHAAALSSKFNNSVPGTCDGSLPSGSLYDLNFGIGNVNGDWTHFHRGLNNVDEDCLMDEWTLAHFDYELACSAVFATQLEEYQELMHRFVSGADVSGVSMEPMGKTTDRLQVWPEKATPATDTSGGFLGEAVDKNEEKNEDKNEGKNEVKNEDKNEDKNGDQNEDENECEVPIVYGGDFGETGEFMEWWNLGGYGH